jgi:hypothetical protein
VRKLCRSTQSKSAWLQRGELQSGPGSTLVHQRHLRSPFKVHELREGNRFIAERLWTPWARFRAQRDEAEGAESFSDALVDFAAGDGTSHEGRPDERPGVKMRGLQRRI